MTTPSGLRHAEQGPDLPALRVLGALPTTRRAACRRGFDSRRRPRVAHSTQHTGSRCARHATRGGGWSRGGEVSSSELPPTRMTMEARRGVGDLTVRVSGSGSEAVRWDYVSYELIFFSPGSIDNEANPYLTAPMGDMNPSHLMVGCLRRKNMNGTRSNSVLSGLISPMTLHICVSQGTGHTNEMLCN